MDEQGGSKVVSQHGGKRRGSGQKPSRVSLDMRFDLMQTLRAKGMDPLAEVVWAMEENKQIYLEARARERRLNPSDPGRVNWFQMNALAAFQASAIHLMEFVYPKRKAVELTGKDGEELFQSLTDLFRDIPIEAQATPVKSE